MVHKTKLQAILGQSKNGAISHIINIVLYQGEKVKEEFFKLWAKFGNICKEQETLREFLNKPGNYYNGQTWQAARMRKLVKDADKIGDKMRELNPCYELLIGNRKYREEYKKWKSDNNIG